MAFAALLDGLQIKSHGEVLADFKAHLKPVDYADAFADGVETGVHSRREWRPRRASRSPLPT